MSGKQWMLIIHNLLFFVQDEGELSICTNASLSIKHFLDITAETGNEALSMCFSRFLLPGLEFCLKAKSEPVRSEVMAIFVHAIEKGGHFSSLKDMTVLFASGDEEANFFHNIFHIQIHRRMRALRCLTDFCDEPEFRNSTLQDHFCTYPEGFYWRSRD